MMTPATISKFKDFGVLMTVSDEKVLKDIETIITYMGNASGDPGSLKFWQSLGTKHSDLIRKHGFRNFKRTVNFEYSQWGVTSIRDPKVTGLVKSILRKGRLPVGAWLARCDMGDLESIRWPDQIDPRDGSALGESVLGGRERARAYARYCGLLWQFACLEDRLGCLDKVSEPSLGNPLPISYRGRLISQDLALSSLELNRIAGIVPMDRVRRILEIGAGYGRLAYLIRSLYPQVEYSILDIPPALAISQNYLGALFGQDKISNYSDSPKKPDGFRFFLPGQIDAVPDGYFDLVINISSFDEMDPKIVEGYFQTIDRVGKGWFYLVGHEKSRKPGSRWGLEEFPYRSHWKELLSCANPVVPGFIEKAFRLR